MSSLFNIVPLEKKYINQVVQIHRSELSYTLNSRLGFEHLYFVYQVMSQNPEAYVGVALFENRPVGVVSGVINTENIKRELLSLLKPHQLLGILLKITFHPTLLYEWWKGNVIGKEVLYEEVIISPTLTTIAVDSTFHGKGIGATLVHSMESFFKNNNKQYYRLDTLKANLKANQFYKNLGFKKITERVDSFIYVKKINNE